MKEGAERTALEIVLGPCLRRLLSARSRADPAHPPTEADSVEHVKHGAKQGTCIHAGICDFGCPVKAKNTLDVNYLYLAERKGAEIRPLHLVRQIEPQGSRYRVTFDRLRMADSFPAVRTPTG
jgi:hypothetical protein